MRWGHQDGLLPASLQEIEEWEEAMIGSYFDENPAGKAIVDEIPLFCRLRTYELFAWAHMLNRPRPTAWTDKPGFKITAR
jgi:hypothetical protein